MNQDLSTTEVLRRIAARAEREAQAKWELLQTAKRASQHSKDWEDNCRTEWLTANAAEYRAKQDAAEGADTLRNPDDEANDESDATAPTEP